MRQCRKATSGDFSLLEIMLPCNLCRHAVPGWVCLASPELGSAATTNVATAHSLLKFPCGTADTDNYRMRIPINLSQGVMMRRVSVAAVLLLVTVLIPLPAVAGKVQRPDMITFPSKSGDVYFNHQRHAKASGTCKPCHVRTGGKIKGLGKAWAHKVCRGCHESAKAGPIECQGCHHQQKKKAITGKGSP